MLPSQRRRQMLEDMGLPVWVCREQLAGLAIADQRDHLSRSSGSEHSERLQRLSASLEPVARSPRRRQRTAGSKQAPPTEQSQRSAGAGNEQSLPALQSTWLGSWLLLAAPRRDARVRRFTRDLLWAAAADTGTPSQLDIDARQLAADVGAEQALAALTAFVEKRLGLIQAQGLLLETSLSQWQRWLSLEAPEAPSVPRFRSASGLQTPVILLPDLLTLMNDGAAKLRCWEQLKAIQQAATGVAG
ncbi:MAG: hypothetical protein ACR2PZ_18435 [Pseudomonadales bacterium]